MAANTTRLLKIVHASCEVFDTDQQAVTDMKKLIGLGSHMLCGTESGTVTRQKKVEPLLREAGYKVFMPDGTDGWLAVKNSLIHRNWKTDYQQVIKSAPAMGDPHPYGPRGVVKATWEHDTLGQITLVGGGHYLTKGRYPGQAQQDNPKCKVNHVEWNKKIAKAMTDACIEGSKGNGISFFTADCNLVDRTTDVFYGAPLTTCWDELKKWPDTGHGNIDVVATVDSDNRVECEKAYALTDERFKLFTDHYPVYTEYRVKKLGDNA